MIDIHAGLGNRSKIKSRFPALVNNLHKRTTFESGDTRNNLNTGTLYRNAKLVLSGLFRIPHNCVSLRVKRKESPRICLPVSKCVYFYKIIPYQHEGNIDAKSK